MTDILIRDVPEDVVAVIDANAQRAGLSRSEYLRRTLARERPRSDTKVSIEDFERLAERVADLDDPDVMSNAWR